MTARCAPPQERRFRAVLGIAVTLALGSAVLADAKEDEAAAFIEKHGGSVNRDWDNPDQPVVVGGRGGKPDREACLRRLPRLPCLKSIGLFDCRFAPGVLRTVGELKG